MDAVVLIENIIKNFLEEERIKNFEDKLLLNEFKVNTLKGYLLVSTICGTLLMIVFLIISFNLFQSNLEIVLLLTLLGFILPFLAIYLFTDVLFEYRKRQKEELLSDLLLEASVFCDESSMEQTIKKIAEQDFELISLDFKRAYIEIKNGASIETALNRIKALNKSRAYTRVIDLFIQGYLSGASISDTLKETAEDLLETKAILKERQAVMIVTKYTLILSSGLIVPAVLGLIVGLVTGLNFYSMGEIGLGVSVETRKALFEMAILGTSVYIFEYSLLSSFFLALQEGNKKNFWIYALILTPISTIIFTLAKTL